MNQELLKKIGERIVRIRKSKNLTQANLAEELGMTSSAFSKIELGINNTPILRLFQIAETLEVDITDFFETKQGVAEPKTQYEFATKDDFESLKRMFENFARDVYSRLPQKKTKDKSYTLKNKKSGNKKL